MTGTPTSNPHPTPAYLLVKATHLFPTHSPGISTYAFRPQVSKGLSLFRLLSECHGLVADKHQKFTSPGLESGKSKVNERTEPGLAGPASWSVRGCLLAASSQTPFMRTPPLGPNHLPKFHLLTPSHWGLGCQHWRVIQTCSLHP